MQTRSRAELVTQALINAQVPGLGQDPSAEDADRADGFVDGLLQKLMVRGVTDVIHDELIPVEYFNDLAALLAYEIAPAFGAPRDNQIRDDAEEQLRVISRTSPASRATLRTDIALRIGHRRYGTYRF